MKVLSKKQKKLDKNNDGKISGEDFKMMAYGGKMPEYMGGGMMPEYMGGGMMPEYARGGAMSNMRAMAPMGRGMSSQSEAMMMQIVEMARAGDPMAIKILESIQMNMGNRMAAR
tara:strand:+ start:507 stop:848 length:342 start_codon:yes stop_codon:yes gene_type:complete